MNLLKTKILNQMSNIIEKKSKEESMLQRLKDTRTEFIKKISVISIEKTSPKNLILESYEDNNIITMESKKSKPKFDSEEMKKVESNLDLIESSVKPRKGDCTPKSNHSLERMNLVTIRSNDMLESKESEFTKFEDKLDLNTVEKYTKLINEISENNKKCNPINNSIKKSKNNSNSNSRPNSKEIIGKTTSKSNFIHKIEKSTKKNILTKLQENLQKQQKNINKNNLLKSNNSKSPKNNSKGKFVTQKKNQNSNVKKLTLIKNQNNLSVSSYSDQNSDEFIQKLQDRLVDEKEIPVNKIEVTENILNPNSDVPIPTEYTAKNLALNTEHRTNLHTNEETLQNKLNTEDNNIKINKNNLDLKKSKSQNKNIIARSIIYRPIPTKKTKSPEPFQKNKNDYSKFDVQKISYEINREYSKTKINKEESFLNRMMFDSFKRQTKEKRIENLLEKNKVRKNESGRINTFNRLIEDANRRLEAQEKLESLKTNLHQSEEFETINKKKTTSEEWHSIYTERFINYKKVKESELERKIILKEKQLKEDEDKVIAEINERTKKAPKQVVEKIINKLYDDAEKRKIVTANRLKEIKIYDEKKKRDSINNAKRFKTEVDHKVRSDLSKPTQTYLAKVSNSREIQSKNTERLNKINILPSKNKNKINVKGKFIFTKLDEYLNTIINTEEAKSLMPMSTEYYTDGMSSNLQFNTSPVNSFNTGRIQTTNDIKSDRISSKSNNNFQKKHIQYLPDYMAQNLVGSILDRK